MRKRGAKLTLMAMLACAGVGSGACWWWNGRPDRYLAKAEHHLADGDPDAAIAWLAVPEATRATRDRALILRARAALLRHRPGDAIAPLDRVDPRGPQAIAANYWKGRTLYEAKAPRLAVAWFQRVLEDRPRDAETLRWLAAAAYDLGDWSTAVRSLRQVTRLEPRDTRAWRTLGVLYKEEVKLDEARTAYESCLAIDSRQPAVQLELAEVLVAQGRFAEAQRPLDACRGAVTESGRLELLAQCLRGLGKPDDARSLLDAALATFPEHPGLLARRASIAQAEGKADEAATLLDRAVAADPENSELLYQRGRVLRALGRTTEADRDLARAAMLNQAKAEMSAMSTQANRAPDDPEIRCRLGRLCARLGKPELAAYWYRAALACEPNYSEAKLGLKALKPH